MTREEARTDLMLAQADISYRPKDDSIDMAIKALENQKTGHWRHYEGMLICSECETKFYDDIMEYCGDDVPKCCPNCGARMEGENNE